MRSPALMITMPYIRIMTAEMQLRDVMLSFKVSLKLKVKLRMPLNTG